MYAPSVEINQNEGDRVFAPVALFVYTRLDNTKKTVAHLKQNRLAGDTVLYVFSDGGKDARSQLEVDRVREYLHTITGFKEVHVIERSTNYYLERNVIEGIGYVLSLWDRVIVLEDDVCTSPYFLEYMNDALTAYKNEEKVMHVTGFTRLQIEGKGDTYFTPHAAGWGWGTWRDRWAHFKHFRNRCEALEGLTEEDENRLQYGGAFQCLKSLDRDPIPWDICWEIAIYKNRGLSLSPTRTLVRNIGIYSGTHFNHYRILGTYCYDVPFTNQRVNIDPTLPIAPDKEIEEMYPAAFKDHGMRYTLLGKVIRYFYLKLKPKR